MKISELRNNIKLELTSKINDEFLLDINGEGFSFTRIDHEITYQFGGNFREGVDMIYCDNFNAGIRLNEVEELLTPILVETEILGPKANSENRWTLGIAQNLKFYNLGLELLNELNIEIRSELDILNFANHIDLYYRNAAKVFFAKWKKIADFENLLEDLTPRELTQTFGTGGIFKKAIIYYLNGNEHYTEFVDEIIKNLYSVKLSKPDEIQYQRFYSAAVLLKKRLDSKEL